MQMVASGVIPRSHRNKGGPTDESFQPLQERCFLWLGGDLYNTLKERKTQRRNGCPLNKILQFSTKVKVQKFYPQDVLQAGKRQVLCFNL